MAVRFSYTGETSGHRSDAYLMPRLSLRLHYGDQSADVVGLLDTGSAVNVLPYSVGLALGARWEAQGLRVPLVGALGNTEARALVVFASHPQVTPEGAVRLVFAWTRRDDVPAVFGQVNFFMQFDVCFFRSQAAFEIAPRPRR